MNFRTLITYKCLLLLLLVRFLENAATITYREIEGAQGCRHERLVRLDREESAITALIVLLRRVRCKVQKTQHLLLLLLLYLLR